MRSMTSACWGVSRSFSRGVLPFSLPLMMRIRLSRYSSVYFSGSHFALRLSTSCFAIFSSAGANVAGLREAEVAEVGELVGKAHHRQHQRIVDGFDRGEMLRVAEDDLGDADLSRRRGSLRG